MLVFSAKVLVRRSPPGKPTAIKAEMKRQRISAVVALGVLSLSQAAWAQEFAVRRVSDDEAVLTGELGREQVDSTTAFTVQLADFSELREPGEYYLDVDGVGRSVSFRVAPDVYDGELANVMLGFYGWRSGIDIAFERHGVAFAHAKGHLEDGLLDYVDGQLGVKQDGTGGWYDAGDYGKYLPTASETLVTMLAAWELFSDRLQYLSLPFIPEHGSDLPDYLSELKWELDWMMKMAYADGSGRVHHKLNSANFPGFIQPTADLSKRYFSAYSTASTAELVATLAKAARVFAPYDDVTDGYSEKLLAAAQLSYAYLQEHPDDVQYDSSVLRAGEYKKDDVNDRLWAAAELWETTGDADVLADYEQRSYVGEVLSPNFDWDQTRHFAIMTYALSEREGRDPVKLTAARKTVSDAAEELVFNHTVSGYGRAYPGYYWGSNGVIARTCMLLQSANHLSPDARFVDVCADQIAHLYGRNQYNRSYVTGAGIAPPEHPHHRPSGADSVAAPYPGLLVGGGQTASNWKDQQSDFSSNEVAINWNAALVYALAGFVQGEGAEESLGRAATAPADCSVRVSSAGYVPGQSKVATVQRECDLPDTFQCTLPEATLSGDTSGAPVLIDDLEDGDTQIVASDGRQGAWFAFDDGSAGTRTEPTVKPDGAQGSPSALCIAGEGFTTWGGGLALDLNNPLAQRALYDASAYTGISFWARGAGTFRAMGVDKYSDPAASLCSGCYDHFQAPFTATDAWQHYSFSWPQLKQQGFGDMQPNVCASELLALQFQWPANAGFELCLDDVAFTTSAGSSDPDVVETPGASPVRVSGGGCACRSAGGPHGSSQLAAATLGLLALALTRRQGARFRVRLDFFGARGVDQVRRCRRRRHPEG
jgi:endoglucanase